MPRKLDAILNSIKLKQINNINTAKDEKLLAHDLARVCEDILTTPGANSTIDLAHYHNEKIRGLLACETTPIKQMQALVIYGEQQLGVLNAQCNTCKVTPETLNAINALSVINTWLIRKIDEIAKEKNCQFVNDFEPGQESGKTIDFNKQLSRWAQSCKQTYDIISDEICCGRNEKLQVCSEKLSELAIDIIPLQAQILKMIK